MESVEIRVFNPAAVVETTGRSGGGGSVETALEKPIGPQISAISRAKALRGELPLSSETQAAIAAGATPPVIIIPRDEVDISGEAEAAFEASSAAAAVSTSIPATPAPELSASAAESVASAPEISIDLEV